MANKILLRRGIMSQMPALSQGEPAFATDDGQLYVGNGDVNVNVSGSRWIIGSDFVISNPKPNRYYGFEACPTVKTDDIYLNNESGHLFICTGGGTGGDAVWEYKATIALSTSSGS